MGAGLKSVQRAAMLATLGGLGAVAGGASSWAADAVVTVVVSDPTAAERLSTDARDSGAFVLKRSGSTAAPLTVNIQMGGTATNGGDCGTVGSTVTFAAAAAAVKVNINVKDDSTAEGAETAVLTVLPGTGYTLGTANGGTVTIADNEPAKAGTPVWLRQFGVPGTEWPTAMAVTPDNFWVGGFTGTDYSASGTPSYGYDDFTDDAWVARFDFNGSQQGGFALLATPRLGPLIQPPNVNYGYYDEQNQEMRRDRNGNMYVTGNVQLTVYKGTGSSPATPGNNLGVVGQDSNAYLAKYAPDGTQLFAKVVVDDSLADAGTGVDTDTSGNVYVSGHIGFSDSAGGYVVKLDANGNQQWKQVISGPLVYARKVAVGGDGQIYTVGHAPAAGQVQSDVFVGRFKPDSTFVYANFVYGTPDDDKVFALARAGRNL